MNKLPEPLAVLVEQLSGLPGIGRKSALRMALTLLKWPEDTARGLGQSILDLRDSLRVCGVCYCLSDTDPCSICDDPTRSDTELCLVSDWDALLVMEESGFFRGRYLVLGGLLSPLDGVQPQNLEIDRLRDRLGQGVVEELILALGTTLEAEATESFLKNMLARQFPDMRLSRLAQGIPLGSDLKYVDRETLKQSLVHRQRL